MDDLYVPQLISVKLQLNPADLKSGFESTIRKIIAAKYGDHCYNNGFIQKHSIEIIRISNGVRRGSHLHGCLTFNVDFSARCCVPRAGTIIPCTIQKVNKFGVMAHAYPIDIIVPRQLQATSDIGLLAEIDRGDLIHVRTMDYRIESDRLIVVGVITQVDLAKPNRIELPTDVPTSLTETTIELVTLNVTEKTPEPNPEWGDETILNQLRTQITPNQKIWDTKISHFLNSHEYVDKDSKQSIIKYNQKETIYDPHALYPVFTRAYFKLWEILTDFKVFESYQNNPIKIANLAEGPGGFIQCLIDFRNRQHSAEWKQDQYFAITIKKDPSRPELAGIQDWSYPLGKQYFDRINSSGYHVHLSYGREGNGDLTNATNIRSFSQEVSGQGYGCDLITGDGGINVSQSDENYNRQEYDNAILFLGEIITALKNQSKGGTFILKIYSLYYDITIQLLHILRMAYREMHLIKPKTSRPANSEKYVVCRDYLGLSPVIIEHLLKLLEEWFRIKSQQRSNYYVNSFSSLIVTPTNFTSSLKDFSQTNTTWQMEKIREGLELIASKRYNDSQTQSELRNNAERLARKWCQTYHLPSK